MDGLAAPAFQLLSGGFCQEKTWAYFIGTAELSLLVLALEELLCMRGGHGASNKVVNGDGVLDSYLSDAWIVVGLVREGARAMRAAGCCRSTTTSLPRQPASTLAASGGGEAQAD